MKVMEDKMENQIVVYQPNDTVRLNVRLENETVWLTQLKIVECLEFRERQSANM